MQRFSILILFAVAVSPSTNAAIVKNPPGVPNGDIGNDNFPNASIEVNGGSVLDEQMGFANFAVEVGRTLGSQGLLHVTGAGSEYNVMFRHFAVGREGQGEVRVDDGGFFGLLTDSFGGRFLFLNNDGMSGTVPTGSSAVVTVDGAGSKFQYGGDRTMPPGSSVLKGGMLIGEVGHARPTEVRVLNGGEFFSPNFLEDDIGFPARADIVGPNTRVTVEGGGSIFTVGVEVLLLDTTQGPGNGGLRLARGGVLENRTGGARLRTTLSVGIGDDGADNTAAGTIVSEIIADLPTLQEITIDPGTTLNVGDSFLIADYASRNLSIGAFGNAGPGETFDAGGYTFDFDYDVPLDDRPGRFGVFMNVIDAPLHGDFNSDGVVNAADYTVWRDNLGGDESALAGAGDASGTVDTGDYHLWRDNFGAIYDANSPTITNVPEPTCLALLALGGLAIAAPYRHPKSVTMGDGSRASRRSW